MSPETCDHPFKLNLVEKIYDEIVKLREEALDPSVDDQQQKWFLPNLL